jgi:hypothetical protein
MMLRRIERDRARRRRAAAAIRACGGSALQAACAHIEATFGPALRHSILKDRVAAAIERGAGHPAVWTRYRHLAERYPVAKLESAIVLVERLHAAECAARAAAIRAWGHSSHPRVALMVLDELRLILRMVRRYAPAGYSGLVGTVLEAGRPMAATVASSSEHDNARVQQVAEAASTQEGQRPAG